MLPDEREPVGAYPITFALQMALAECGLDTFHSIELTYYNVIEPLRNIAQEAEKGGIHRFLAREKFFIRADSTSWYIPDDDLFQDFLDEEDHYLLDGEEIYWQVWHDGPSLDLDGIETIEEALKALISHPEVALIIYEEYPSGYIYVLESPEVSVGTLRKAEDGQINYVFPFPRVVVFGEDHPDCWEFEGPAIPTEILLEAAEIQRREDLELEEYEKRRRMERQNAE